IRPISEKFYRAARELTQKKGAALVMDEIQCGLGRTGQWFGFHKFVSPKEKELLPDMIALAKPLGLGIPMGAVILNEKVSSAIKAGQHGTTFGGGLLACCVSLEYFSIIESEKILQRVCTVGAYFKTRLEELKDLPIVKEVRGEGLMLAVELTISGKEIVKQMLQEGFIINCTHETVLRMLPPFIVTEKQIDKFVKALRPVIQAQKDAG